MKKSKQFNVGQTVTFTKDWIPPRNRKLKFPSGTSGEVESVHRNGKRICISMRFPHGPSMVEYVPATILKGA